VPLLGPSSTLTSGFYSLGRGCRRFQVATKNNKKKYHQGSPRGVAEDEPDLTTDFTVMEQNQTEMEMNLDDGMGSLECDKSCVCSCGREFNSLKGMRIHATRKKCNGPAVEKPLDYECVCGRRFGTERGLKIHHGRKKCYGNADGNGNDFQLISSFIFGQQIR
jgi:hypothetical protein